MITWIYPFFSGLIHFPAPQEKFRSFNMPVDRRPTERNRSRGGRSGDVCSCSWRHDQKQELYQRVELRFFTKLSQVRSSTSLHMIGNHVQHCQRSHPAYDRISTIHCFSPIKISVCKTFTCPLEAAMWIGCKPVRKKAERLRMLMKPFFSETLLVCS